MHIGITVSHHCLRSNNASFKLGKSVFNLYFVYVAVACVCLCVLLQQSEAAYLDVFVHAKSECSVGKKTEFSKNKEKIVACTHVISPRTKLTNTRALKNPQFHIHILCKCKKTNREFTCKRHSQSQQKLQRNRNSCASTACVCARSFSV